MRSLNWRQQQPNFGNEIQIPSSTDDIINVDLNCVSGTDLSKPLFEENNTNSKEEQKLIKTDDDIDSDL